MGMASKDTGLKNLVPVLLVAFCVVLGSWVVSGHARPLGTDSPDTFKAAPISKAPELRFRIIQAHLPVVGLELSLPEPVEFKTWRRLVLSLRHPSGKEYFRAMLNASDRVDPMPPWGFAVYKPRGNKPGRRSSWQSAGIKAQTRVESGPAALLPQSSVGQQGKRLRVKWFLDLNRLKPGPDKYQLWVRIIPYGKNQGIDYFLAHLGSKGLFAATATPPPAPRPFPGQPRYGHLFEYGEYLAYRVGDWARALRIWSRIYDCEVPVDVFFLTLERHIARVIKSLHGHCAFWVAPKKFRLDEISNWFQHVLLTQPEVLYFQVQTKNKSPWPGWFTCSW